MPQQQSSLVLGAGTPVMPQRPVLARKSDVLQEESATPILDELRRISALLMASQEQMCARLAAEVQQVRAEVQHVQTGQAKVCAEMRAERRAP
jgi:hypothetical protein